MNARIRITVRGRGGTASAEFDAAVWSGKSAFDRVLALHGQCRSATLGQPFDVIRVERVRA